MILCELCGRPADCTHHLIFGTGLRRLADEDGLTMSLCNNCHNTGIATLKIHENVAAERLSKMLGQERWEKKQMAAGKTEQEARVLFIARYGRSWL